MMLRTLIVVLLLCIGLPSQAQDGTRDKLRLAATYERTGDMRSAARIYLELLEARPTDNAAYEGVLRTLTALGQFSSLLPVVEDREQRQPSADVSMQLAGVYWKLGKQQDAIAAWSRAVDRAGNDAEAWAMVAESQAAVLANAIAIESFLRARDKQDDADAFAAQLSALYIALGNVEQGAQEVLKDLRSSNDLMRAQGRLSAIMSTPKGVAVVGALLDTETDERGDLARLRQWYYREVKNWKAALAVTIELDKRSKAQGQELLQFGDGARRDGAYDIAIEAYETVLAGNPNEQRRLTAIYSYARTLDQKLRAGSTFDKRDAQRIIDRYAGIVRDFPSHWYASNALYQMALLEIDILGNTDKGRDLLQRLVNQYQGTQAAADGALRLARIYIGVEEFDIADQYLTGLARTTSSETQAQRDVALVIRGDLAAWRGKIDSAQALYAKVAAVPGSTAANDALDRLLMLQLADQDSAAVATMRQADKLAATGKASAAAATYHAAATTARDRELRDRCNLSAAEQYMTIGQETMAMTLLDAIIVDVPETIFGDRALFRKADLALRRKDVPMAVEALTVLLVQYPRSILLPDARERLRALRGDS